MEVVVGCQRLADNNFSFEEQTFSTKNAQLFFQSISWTWFDGSRRTVRSWDVFFFFQADIVYFAGVGEEGLTTMFLLPKTQGKKVGG